MNYLLLVFGVFNSILTVAICQKCDVYCPQSEGEMQCGLDPIQKKYTMFPSECTMRAHSLCHDIHFVKTALKFCINSQVRQTRRMYGESCPVFCPSHYRPVCGMSKLRTYIYKTFNNACFFDMLNCRGDELDGYVEVPLSFCQRHLMKNIFKEQVVISGFHDYRDYHEY